MTTVGPVQVLLVLVRLVLVLTGREVPGVLLVPLALLVLPVLVVVLVLLVLLVRAMALPGRETARLPATRTALVSTAMVLPKAVLLKVAGSQVLGVRVTRDRPGRMPPRPMGQVRVARGA